MTQSISTIKNKLNLYPRQNNRNLAIDILRIILAVLVVYLHIDNLLYLRSGLSVPATTVDNYIIVLARLAVPMFFTISGYYFFKGNQNKEYASAIKNIKHLLWILMGGLVLYFLGSLILNGINGTLETVTSRNLFYFAFLDRTQVITNAGLLWFILALIFCYGIYYIFPRFCKKKYLYLIAAILWCLAICKGSVYGGTVMEKWPAIVQQSYIGLGLPYFTLGYLIHSCSDKISAILNNKLLIKTFILSIALYLIEQTIFLANHQFNATAIENPITLPLLVACILIIAIRHPGKSMPRLSSFAAKYSLYIYITHFLVAMILSRLLYGEDIPNKIRYWKGLVCWAIVITICIAISFAYSTAKRVMASLLAKHGKIIAIT